MNLSSRPPKTRGPNSASRRALINTYYRADLKNQTTSPFMKKSRPGRTRRYFFGFLDIVLILGLLAALGYSLLISPHPKVIATNQDFHPLSDYQAYADRLFSKIGNRNKLTYDEGAVTSSMEKNFPEIDAISTEIPVFSSRPTLRLDVSQPSLKVKSGPRTYILDSKGVIVMTAGQSPGSRNLPLVIDQSGFKAAPGEPLLNTGAVYFIKTVIAETKAAKVPISSMTLPAVPQEVDLRTSDAAYYVKFYLGGDPLVQSGQYLAARNRFMRSNQPPSSYLDVRIAGKVFYK